MQIGYHELLLHPRSTVSSKCPPEGFPAHSNISNFRRPQYASKSYDTMVNYNGYRYLLIRFIMLCETAISMAHCLFLQYWQVPLLPIECIKELFAASA